MAGQGVFEFRAKFRIRQVASAALGDNHHVRRSGQLLIVPAEELAQPPLDPIARDGPTNFTADGYPEPGGARRPVHDDDLEMCRMAPTPRTPDAIELPAAMQPAR